MDSNIDKGASSGGEGDGQTRTVDGQEVLRGDYNIKPRDRIYQAERAPQVPLVQGKLKMGSDETLLGLDIPEEEHELNQRLDLLMSELGIGSQEETDQTTVINEQTPPNQGTEEGR